MKLALSTAFILLSLALSACGGGQPSQAGGDDRSTESTEATRASFTGQDEYDGKTRPDVEVPSEAPVKKLIIEDLEVGSGRQAKKGDEVTVNYVGIHWTGRPYADSWTYAEPPSFVLGASPWITLGLDLGIRGMRVGGRREIKFPPKLIYRKGDTDVVFGPDNTLVFVVDLFAVK